MFLMGIDVFRGIQMAVSVIHSLGLEKGHMGGGSINHDCTYGFVARNKPQDKAPDTSLNTQ